MANKQRRFLGDLDAATDTRFREHFVESVDLQRILNNESDIIFGSKGVGKTALRRALTELHQSSYYATKSIDLDQISFSQVHVALSKVKDTTQADIAKVASNTWRNVLALYCLEAVAETLAHSNPLRRGIDKLIEEEGINGASSNYRLISQIERFLLKIAEIGLDDEASAPLGLSKNQLAIVHDFPSNSDLTPLLEQSVDLVQRSNKKVMICIDGFDSIIDHTPESRRAIFSGLVDAIHKCSRDAVLSNAFCFKVFLPRELTDNVHTVVWDSDKYILNQRYLKWSMKDFQRFLFKRLRPYARTKSSHFEDIWSEFLPDIVRNTIHNLDEPTFNYVLRHTLYRPRQVLTHFQRIFDSWDEKSSSLKVDPTFIPKIVASTNIDLARSITSQLEIEYPGIGNFMQSWNGMNNTMTVGVFLERMKRFFASQSMPDVYSLFDDLFNFGIFGVAQRRRIAKNAQSTRFRFSYVDDSFPTPIHTAIEEHDLIALSPMFHEFAGCIASEVGAVIPTS